MKLDILAFGAHPDDVELSCGGTLIKHIIAGKKAGIIDLTRGELGTRGSVDIRAAEAAKASKIIGLSVRGNLHFEDGFITNDKVHQLEVVKIIRRYTPEIVIANAIEDRHPDHGKASKLVSEACFLAGLIKIETKDGDTPQQPWRVKAVYHYTQDRYIKPDFVIDITDVMDKRTEAILSFQSQFYNPNSKEPETPISTEKFQDYLNSKAVAFGRSIGVRYAEGFTVERTPGVASLFDLK